MLAPLQTLEGNFVQGSGTIETITFEEFTPIPKCTSDEKIEYSVFMDGSD